MLRTKLHRPPVSRDHVIRNDLNERFEKFRSLPFTLVSAPAGYGKSIAASHWLNSVNVPYGWLSLDEEHNDLKVFLNYMLTLLEGVFPGRWYDLNAHLKARALPSSKTLLHELINSLDEIEDEFVVVLDDYHLISSYEVHEFVDYMLQYPPENMHLVIITRKDPPLKITHLRAYNRMGEVRSSDLIFKEDDIRKLLFRLKVIHEEEPTLIQTIALKTEGWITAIRLVLIDSTEEEIFERIVNGLSGTSHSVSEYLMYEVLANQTAEFTEMLAKAALFDRFCGPLLDSLSPDVSANDKQFTGQEFVSQFDESNLFVIPLDSDHTWFRFHHLFQDLLKNQLRQTLDEIAIGEIYGYASEWFDGQGLVGEAINYTLKSSKPERAAVLVEQYRHEMFKLGQSSHVMRWIQKIDTDLRSERPALVLSEAWHAFGQFRMELIPGIVERASTLLDKNTDPEIRAEYYFFKGNVSYWAGATEEALSYLRSAHELISPAEENVKGNINLLLAMALYTEGESEMANQNLKIEIERHGSYRPFLTAFLRGALALNHLFAADLRLAKEEGELMIAALIDQPFAILVGWGHYFVGSSLFRSGKLKLAAQALDKAAGHRYILDLRAVIDTLASASVCQSMLGNTANSDSLHRSLKSFVLDLGNPLAQSFVSSLSCRLALMSGTREKVALAWARSYNQPPDMQSLFCWNDVPQISAVKALIALGSARDYDNIENRLNSLFKVCEKYKLVYHKIDLYVCRSLFAQKQKRTQGAIDNIYEAIKIATKQEIFQPFMEAGHSLKSIIIAAKHRMELAELDFAERVEDLLNETKNLRSSIMQVRELSVTSEPQSMTFSEKIATLTVREFETLNHLAKGLRNKEIADIMFISTESVKKYLYRIYQKLDVRNRIELVNKARELDLLT